MLNIRTGIMTTGVAFLASLALVAGSPMSAQAASHTYYNPSGGAPIDTWSPLFQGVTEYTKTYVETYADSGATAFSRVDGIGSASGLMNVTQTFPARMVKANCKWASYMPAGTRGYILCSVTQ